MVKLEDQIEALVDELYRKLSVLTEDPYMREAAAKLVLREMAWHSVLTLDASQYEIADHLELMANLVREHKEKKKK